MSAAMELLDLRLACESLPTLTVLSATIHERLSSPTRATVRAFTRDTVNLRASLDRDATIEVIVKGAVARTFPLVVAAASFVGLGRDGEIVVELDLEHELSRLRLRRDLRWFQEKTAREIVTEVFEGAGVPAGHTTWSVERDLAKRLWCVQHRESDFDFASRLLEHEGIFYVCGESSGAAHLELSDHSAALPEIDGGAVALRADDSFGPGVDTFEVVSTAVADTVVLDDYSELTPGVELRSRHAAASPAGGEHYEPWAGFTSQDEGEALARIRHEELAAGRIVGRGESDRMALRAGAIFELDDPGGTFSRRWLLRVVDHSFEVRRGALGGEDRTTYRNTFECMPADVPHRPPRVTPRPRAAGLATAVVTSPGDEIHTDELGRLKAQFVWDRLGAGDDKSSTWMRLVQLPISGSMALARTEWEMSVVHVDGDPDRPIVLQRLYTAEKVSPYGYPTAKTRMALQTPSSPGGGNSNELRMEDGGGGMEVFVHASKRYDAKTLNDETHDIGVNDTIQIGTDADVTVGVDETIDVGAAENVTIGSDEGMAVGGSRTKTVGGSETVTVSGNESITIQGSDGETTGGTHTTLAAMGVSKTSTGSFSLTVGGSMVSASGLAIGVMVAGAKSETVGGASIAACGTTVAENVAGALARTVGGVLVQAAAGNRLATTKGTAAITVGGVMSATAAGKLSIKAKKVTIRVGGVANLLGGGGVLTLTPASASFAGLVSLDASGAIKISGNPNLVG